jgi:hypothetical protein
MHDALDTLRVFRDVWLLHSSLGTAFVDTYYRLSPPLADLIAQAPVLAACVRIVLWPVIFVVRLLLALPPASALVAVGVAVLAKLLRRKKSKA